MTTTAAKEAAETTKSSTITLASPLSTMPIKSELQQRVLSLALVRLSDSLGSAAHSDNLRITCEQLGVEHRALADAVRERLRKEERNLDGGDDSASAQVHGRSEGVTTSTVASGRLIAALVQDLSSAFFSQEVLHGERALGDARARLAGLWDKHMELTEEREKNLRGLNLTSDTRQLFASLAQVLTQQTRAQRPCDALTYATTTYYLFGGEEGGRPLAMSTHCVAGDGCRSPGFGVDALVESFGESPAARPFTEATSATSTPAGSPRLAGSPTSRIPMPRAGRRRRSVTAGTSPPASPAAASAAPISLHRRGEMATPSSEPPPQRRRRFLSPPTSPTLLRGGLICDRCGGGGNGGVVRLSDKGVGSRGGPLGGSCTTAVAEGGDNFNLNRMKKEVEELRDQRDALTRSLAFARSQHADALGDKPMQIKSLTKEVDQLRCTLDGLREELTEEKRGREGQAELFERDVASFREAAGVAARRLEEAEKRTAFADTRVSDVEADHADAIKVLENTIHALKAKLSATVTERESLRGRLDATLSEMEGMLESNSILRAEADARRHAAEESESLLLRQAAAERDASVAEGKRLLNELDETKAELSSLRAETVILRDAERATSVEAAVEMDSLRASLERAHRDAVDATTTAEAEGAAAEAKAAAAEAKASAEHAVAGEERAARIEAVSDAKAAAAAMATAVDERHAWAVRSGEWEFEAERLAKALKASEAETAEAREGLEAALDAARRELAEAHQGLREAGLRRGEEAAIAGLKETKLKDKLEIAQASIRAFMTEELKAARATEAATAATADDMANLREGLRAARDQLGVVEEERDSALQSLLEFAQIRKVRTICRRGGGGAAGDGSGDDGSIDDVGGRGGVVGGGESRSCAFSSDDSEGRIQAYSARDRIGRNGGGRSRDRGGGEGGSDIGRTVRSNGESDMRPRSSWNPAYALHEDGGRGRGGGGSHDDTQSNPGAYDIVRERSGGGAVHEDDLTFLQDAVIGVGGEEKADGSGEGGDGSDDSVRVVVIDDDADNVRLTETSSSNAGGGLSSIASAESARLNDGVAWMHDNSDHASTAAGNGNGDGGVDSGSEQECRVCGAPSSALRKLFDCRLSLGRLKVDAMEALHRKAEAVEGATLAAEDAMASRCERKAAEDSLAENVRQLEAVQLELAKALSSAREQEAKSGADGMRTRLAGVEAQLADREAIAFTDLSCIPDTARALSATDNSSTHDGTDLVNTKAALDQARADLAERSRELQVLRAHADVTARDAAAAKTAAAAQADAAESVAAAALARVVREADATREAGEESLRLAKAEAESTLRMEREKMELGAAEATARAVTAAVAVASTTTSLAEEKAAKEAGAVAAEAVAKAARDTKAAKEASARYAADLSIAERERDVLEEKCARLQARVEEIENAKLASDAILRQTESSNAERMEAIRRSFRDETSRCEQMESMLTTTREALEQRLAAAEDAAATATAELETQRRVASSEARAAADRLSAETAELTAAKAAQRELRQAWREKAREAEARVLERVEGEVAASEAALKEEVDEAVEAVARREGEITTLTVRLRSAEEDVETAKREAFLEGNARSADEVAGAERKTAEARSAAEALRQRYERQEEAIAELASAREEEAEACRVARESLTKERLALAKSEARERGLQNEVDRLLSSLEDTTPKPYEQSRRRGREEVENDAEMPIGGEVQRMTWDGGRLAGAIGGGGGSGGRMEGARETKERERVRSAVFTLEESLHAAMDEAEHLRRRVTRLRAGLREAELRGNEMEAAAASARAVASAARAAAEAATTEADVARVRTREAEQQTRAAGRREQEKTDALQAELSRVASDARAARRKGEEERDEASRLRSALGESNRGIAMLEEALASSAADLRAAEAGKARAQLDLIRGLGDGGEVPGGREGGGQGEVGKRRGRHEDGEFSTGQVTAVSVGMEDDDVLVEVGVSAEGGRLLQVTGFAATPPPTPLSDSVFPAGRDGDGRFRSGNPLKHRTSTAVEADHRRSEAAMLREKLAASQAQHQELVTASKRAVARCSQRCDARVRAALAAGTLTSACCRRRGMIAGREAAVEAAAQHSLVRQCFAALREEALRRSRDRSVRRQERLQRWVGEAVRWSGEELSFATTTMKRNRNR